MFAIEFGTDGSVSRRLKNKKLRTREHLTTRGLQAYLGHRYIQRTVRYTELSSDRFTGWWKD
jgi:hypothetical protein